MLRLTWISGRSVNRLKVEGEITGAESRVFWDECEKGLYGPVPFEIDLGGVTYLGNAQADRLRNLARASVRFLNCPAFAWALLNFSEKNPNQPKLCTGTVRKRKVHKPPQEFL